MEKFRVFYKGGYQTFDNRNDAYTYVACRELEGMSCSIVQIGAKGSEWTVYKTPSLPAEY